MTAQSTSRGRTGPKENPYALESLEARVMLSGGSAHAINLNLRHEVQVTGSANTLYRFKLKAGQRYLFMGDYSTDLSLLNSKRREIKASSANYMYATPRKSGTHFLRVKIDPEYQQEFHLLAKPIFDDFGNNSHAAAAVAKGQVIRGQLDHPEDFDYFRFEGVKGERWAFDVEAENQINTNMINDGGQRTICHDGCEPLPYTGTYFIWLDANGDMQPYTIRARRVVDDNEGRKEGAAALTIGVTATGTFDFRGDDDWFAFDASAGKTYAFVVSTGVHHSFEMAIYNADGSATAPENSYSSRRSNSDRLEWIAPADGKFHLQIRGYDGGAAYTISSVIQERQEAVGAAVAEPLSFGELVEGRIDVAGGSRYFSFSAVKNATYRFLTDGGATSDGMVIGRIGLDGRSIIEQDTPTNRPWTAPETGTYFFWVRFYEPSASGTFKMGLDEERDDYGNSAAEAKQIETGVTVQGLPQYYADEDWFKLNVVEGQKYVFSLDRSAAERRQPFYRLRRNRHPYLMLSLMDAGGQELAMGDNDAGGQIRIEWTAVASGTIFLRVTPVFYGTPYALLATTA